MKALQQRAPSKNLSKSKILACQHVKVVVLGTCHLRR